MSHPIAPLPDAAPSHLHELSEVHDGRGYLPGLRVCLGCMAVFRPLTDDEWARWESGELGSTVEDGPLTDSTGIYMVRMR